MAFSESMERIEEILLDPKRNACLPVGRGFVTVTFTWDL